MQFSLTKIALLSFALLGPLGCGGEDSGDDNGAGTAGTGNNGGGAGSTGGGSMPEAPPCVKGTTSITLSAPYDLQRFDKYALRNNFWNPDKPGSGTQTAWGNTFRCWGADATHTDQAPKGTVKSYVNIARGWWISNEGYWNSRHGLGIQNSALTKAKIRWKMRAPTTGRTWALWDIYFHNDANPGAGVAPVNLMIQQRIVDSDRWMQSDSSGWNRVTIGGIKFREKLEKGTTVSSTRDRIQLYVDVENGAVLGIDDMTLDLKAVIDYYIQKGNIKSTDYLTSIQAGWEIVSGGTYQTDDFWTAVQDEPG